MKIWLGVDGTNWITTLYQACGGDAVEVAKVRLKSLLELAKPAATLVCFDRRSFRYDVDPAYKSQRPPKPVELQLALASAEIELAELAPVVSEVGFEADDCLATLARCGVESGAKIVLATPDKDLRQCLVRDRVNMLCSFRTEGGVCFSQQWYTAECLRSRYGLSPDQWADYQALVGDRGDGIAGCEGWGEITAVKVLQKLRTLRAAIANPWSCPVTDRQRNALTRFIPRAETVLQLVTLRTDVAAVADALR